MKTSSAHLLGSVLLLVVGLAAALPQDASSQDSQILISKPGRNFLLERIQHLRRKRSNGTSESVARCFSEGAGDRSYCIPVAEEVEISVCQGKPLGNVIRKLQVYTCQGSCSSSWEHGNSDPNNCKCCFPSSIVKASKQYDCGDGTFAEVLYPSSVQCSCNACIQPNRIRPYGFVHPDYI